MKGNMNSGVYFLNVGDRRNYIGSSSDLARRRRQHLWMLRHGKHKSAEVQSAFNEYGEDAFRFVVAEYVEPEALTEREQKWVSNFEPSMLYTKRRLDMDTNTGITMPAEAVARLSKRMKGKQLHLGHKHSEESRQKISESKVGRPTAKRGKTFPHLQGVKKSMTLEGSATLAARLSKDWLVTFPDGSVESVANLRAFALDKGLNPECLYLVAKGKQKQHKGFTVHSFERESGIAA